MPSIRTGRARGRGQARRRPGRPRRARRRAREAGRRGGPSALERARSAALAAWSATATWLATISRPSRSVSTAVVDERGDARAADRDLLLADAPWPAERVADHHGAAQRRPQRPRRRIGVERQQHRQVLAARVGPVHAGVGADESVAGPADQPAVVGPQDLLGLIHHDLDRARVLVPFAAQSRAQSPGSTVARSTTRPSALLTTLCATHSTSVGRRWKPASRAARSSPGRTSGSPGRRRPRSRRGERREVVRRVDVEGKRRHVDDAHPHAGRAPSAAWRAHEPGPNDGSITDGGSSTSALVPVPWRSGTIVSPGPAPASSASTSAGSSRGQSPGTSSTRAAPPRPRRCRAARPRSGRPRPGRRRRVRRLRGASARRAARA